MRFGRALLIGLLALHLAASCRRQDGSITAKDNEETLRNIRDHEVMRLSASVNARQVPDPVYADAFGTDVRLEIKTFIVDRYDADHGWPRHYITVTSAGKDRQFGTVDDQQATGVGEVEHGVP